MINRGWRLYIILRQYQHWINVSVISSRSLYEKQEIEQMKRAQKREKRWVGGWGRKWHFLLVLTLRFVMVGQIFFVFQCLPVDTERWMSHLSVGRYSTTVARWGTNTPPALPCNGLTGLALHRHPHSLTQSPSRITLHLQQQRGEIPCDVTHAWHRTFYELGQEGEIGHLTRACDMCLYSLLCVCFVCIFPLPGILNVNRTLMLSLIFSFLLLLLLNVSSNFRNQSQHRFTRCYTINI